MKRTGIYILIMLAIVFSFPKNGQSQRQTAKATAPAGMIKIPAGTYKLFLRNDGQPAQVKMKSFYMDIHAVTNADFLAFVKANPKWSRSKVSRLMADEGYLSHWSSDFNIGNPAIANSPVTNVSWFAAEAYAKWKGKRLPSLYEWEYAGGAPPINMKKGEKLSSIILEWYGHPRPKVVPNVQSTFKNTFGLYDMHGLIWEWVHDFNSVMTGGDSRAGGTLDANFYCAAGAVNAVDKEDYASFMRFAFRESLKAAYTVRGLGFRCVKDI